MKVLVIDRASPLDERQGNALIGRHIFPRLAQRHALTLIAPTRPDRLRADRSLLTTTFADVHLIPRNRLIPALAGLVEPVVAGSPLRLALGADERTFVEIFRSTLKAVIRTDGPFDLIHVRQIPMAAYIDRNWPMSVLLEVVDSEALQARRRLRWSVPRSWLRFAAATLAERYVVSRADAVTAVATVDASHLRRAAPHVPIHVVPNGVDSLTFAPVAARPDAGLLVFHGAMSYPPNAEAARWAATEILPLVRKIAPHVRLAVVGRDPTPEVLKLARLPGVTVTGAVDDVRPWLSRAEVFLCPVRSGSGIKNKLLEAMAMACPIVTTPLGIEGLDARDDEHLLVRSETESVASAVIDLLEDRSKATRLGSAAVQLARRYTWDACAAEYDRIYRCLAESER